MREVICKYCGAPIVDDADRCPYCKILYPYKAITRGAYVDIKLGDEIVHTYIGNVEYKTEYNSARDCNGYFKAVEAKQFRKITLVEL